MVTYAAVPAIGTTTTGPRAGGTTTGVISLRGITAVGHHGVFADERTSGQRCVIDVLCHLDVAPAAASDTLSDTVDYAGLAVRVVSVVEGEPVNLIETLADRIGRVCLAEERIAEVEVTVHKPDAPMPVDVADVAVTVRMSRDPAADPRGGHE